jgi:drug/metabolite transporter (DMT)-like permease
MGWLFLIGVVLGICSVFCLFGVVLVSKPEFLFGSGDIVGDDDASWTRIIAILCSLLGAVMSAFAYCTVRKIGRGASYMVHVVYFGGISCVISAIGMYFQGAIMPSGAKEYTTLLLVGITAFIGQCLLNQG